MKKLGLLWALLALVLMGGVTLASKPAEARVFVHVGVGCCGYYPGWGYPAYYYSPYYYPYYAPAPVVYAAPPPMVYAPAPAPFVSYAAPAPMGAPPLAANQTSPTFVDNLGRTCRQFQSTSGGQAFGTACLQPDGSWRAVQ